MENIDVKDLVAKKASLDNSFIKMLVWGGAGSGKSRFALTAPAPVVADLEGSTFQYSDEFDFWRAVVNPQIGYASNCIKLVSTLCEQINQNLYPDRKTLVIDPITDLLDEAENLLAASYEKLIGKNVVELNPMQKTKWYAYRRDGVRRLLEIIKNCPINLILVARSKILWETINGNLKPNGETMDVLPIVEYLMDVVIQLDKNDITVTKSRLGAINETSMKKDAGFNFDSLIKTLKVDKTSLVAKKEV